MLYDNTQPPIDVVNFYTALFEALPSSIALLKADPSHFTILAASNQYVKSAGVKKEDIIGKGIFEAFPSNHATGESELTTSFQQVMQKGKTDYLPIQRYDIKNDDGAFIERYWRASNAPVFAPDGKEVAYILHTVEEITAQVKAERREHQIKGIEKAFDLFMHAPIVIGLAIGDDYVLEMANEEALKLWGKGKDIIGKPLLQAVPELKSQGIIEIFDQVRATGEPYYAQEVPVTTLFNGKEQTHFFNLIYQPYYSEGNAKATGVFTISFDITDQVLARNAVQESEQKYRSLFESIDQGFCVVEVLYDNDSKPFDHLILEINPMFEKQTGLKNVEGKKASEVIPGMEKLWTEMYHKVAAGGEAIRFMEESPAQGKWYEAYCFKIGDRESRKVALLFADITERKKAEAKLRESEQFARILFQTSPAAMLIYTGDDMVLQDANQKMLELLGNDSSIIGKSIFETMPTLKKSPIQSHYNKVRATGQAHKESAGKVELLKRGHSYWGYFDYTYEPLCDATGAVYGVICTAMDVTQVMARQALEANEAALRNAVLLAELGTWTMDVDTGVLLFSERHAALWGMDSLETTADEAISHMIEEDRERISKAFYGALQPGSNGRYEAEFEVVNPKTQAHIIARALGQVFYDTEGKAVTIAGITQDITVQRQTQAALEAQVQQRTAELEAKNKELERSNVNLEEFAYAASHDMKEPIRKIHFFTDRLKSRLSNVLNEEDFRFFSRVEAATQRMSTLIDDLLTYSHISKGVHYKETVDLSETFQLVKEDMELIIEDKKATIVSDRLPTIQGHRRQLQQLFENLIGNALKYSKADVSPKIAITTKRVTGKETHLRLPGDELDKSFHLIEIKDNGIGFEQGDAERIFNVFTRLHGMAEYKGTGVGLSIARKVVENHNGYIWAESVIEEGAIFKLLLPAA